MVLCFNKIKYKSYHILKVKPWELELSTQLTMTNSFSTNPESIICMHLYSICKNQIQLVIIRLYIPKTLSNPEVRIQIRLERYPNRRVDFSKLVAKSFLLKKSNFWYARSICISRTTGSTYQCHSIKLSWNNYFVRIFYLGYNWGSYRSDRNRSCSWSAGYLFNNESFW